MRKNIFFYYLFLCLPNFGKAEEVHTNEYVKYSDLKENNLGIEKFLDKVSATLGCIYEKIILLVNVHIIVVM